VINMEIIVKGKADILSYIDFLIIENAEVELKYKGKKIKINKIKNEKQEILKRIIGWIKKARNEHDYFDRYFALWVAFNIFYNNNSSSKNGGEQERVKDMVNLLDKTSKLTIVSKNKENIKYLIELNPKLYKNPNHDKQLKEKVSKLVELIDSKEINDKDFECLLITLYKIRCNLFHGDKDRTSERQKEIVKYAYNILEYVVSYLLLKWIEREYNENL